MSVTIVQLYPDELGVAGDRGNVLAILERLRAAGIDASSVPYRRGDVLPTVADCVVIGGGPLSAVRTVVEDLRSIAPSLRDWADSGVPFFAFGAGAELLGRSITTVDGEVVDGLGFFPFETRRVPIRKVGYVLTETATGSIVGFEDNSSDWILDEGATPLGRVSTGSGNGDGTEGVVVHLGGGSADGDAGLAGDVLSAGTGESMATQVGGPVLPLNPLLTARLVATIAARAGIRSSEVDDSAAGVLDDYAAKARAVIVANAAHVFARI